MRRAELEAYRGHPVDDLLGPDLRLLFVGINPGLWTAAVNAHFARPGNRFWPALHQAGITTRLVDASAGLPDEDAADLRRRGVGITNLVNVATARADELTRAELRAGAVQAGRARGAGAPSGRGRAGVDRLPQRLRPAEGDRRAAGRRTSGPPSCGWHPTRPG